MNRKRLQAVLRVRTLQERGARGELARRTQAHHRAQAAEERTWELLQAVCCGWWWPTTASIRCTS